MTRRAVLIGTVIVGLVVGAVAPAGAQADPEAERQAARERRAAVAKELDTLTASEAELQRALEDLGRRIDDQEEQLAAARKAVQQAEERLAEIRDEVAATKEAIEELRELVIDRAVSEFIDPPSFDVDAFLQANDLTQATRLRSLLGAVADNDHEAAELLREAEAKLEELEAEAAAATRRARSKRDEVADTLAGLEEDRQEQAKVREALEARIESFKAEADALAAQEEELTRIIAERAAAEQRRIEAERRAAAERAAAERAAQQRQSASGGGGDGGGGGSAAAAPSSPPASSGRIGWPTAGRVTSEYGQRWGRLHAGIDIGAPTGTPIHAVESGTVYFTGWMGGYGNTVLIDHGEGLTTLYAHQSRIAIGNGARVSRGQLIGYVGNTGNSTGPHLHFETRVNGRAQNPRNFL